MKEGLVAKVEAEDEAVAGVKVAGMEDADEGEENPSWVLVQLVGSNLRQCLLWHQQWDFQWRCQRPSQWECLRPQGVKLPTRLAIAAGWKKAVGKAEAGAQNPQIYQTVTGCA
mmetsp:Transcript_15695/g.30772  ORF Transcript_15695/g.30772 Transcript_15695/m.30772 type:complete len:113 (+) Transcript_15695:109-447(+)